ncbi:2-polyprenyl-6-methoxyphenol hydroxylase-like FAD-dependent oxidoreductase [Rhodococcus sp. OK611]|uniref:FAD-dependent monooxygenase n=1 Tax=unclassified Rhodococcus (in: high G+C Gram-positive bacteria) TaxID=192944 RepID=UPI000BCD8064|nr:MULTISPECIES: FAD-dependent monooxygenase [unclassified Rhodococcus (in: high G+C Gram-positive bacteria)]PTR44564.1 2-polyprenyl-6-methoxyphenol hydroxylase-like FAD-dependent oxidoreductase [Rhodococcus sp. OK611]SNX90005.1 2-polyprenyl-6-methoxyphenol hydroxylase [Rhodococcus sp. OK270]
MRRTATVVGGGIGGLTAANYLIRAGWEVRVHERADALPDTGTALGLWPQALTALDAIGLGDRVRELGVPQSSGALLRPDGTAIARITVRGGSTTLLSRPALLSTLAAPLAPGVLRYDTTGDRTGDGADVVIAADGINSRIRDAVFGERYRPRPLGMAAWRGWVSGTADNSAETWGDGALFGISPRDGGLTNFFAAVRMKPDIAGVEPAERPDNSDGGAAFLRERFGSWHPEVRAILDRLDTATLLHHDLYESPALPSYVRGNVALIGDAAHAMAPNLGRGACEAVVDAVALGRALTESADVSEALRRYDRRRRRPTRALVRASRTMGKMATTTRLTPLRDVAIGLATRLG